MRDGYPHPAILRSASLTDAGARRDGAGGRGKIGLFEDKSEGFAVAGTTPTAS